MAPVVGRIAFNIGVSVLILSLIPLPFLPVGSPEFIVDVIAVGASTIFLVFVVWDVRRQARLSGRGRKRDKGQQE
ncbi:MAG: hypothetical protein DRI61_04820 [Chloroflexi bacterium]|nr:MAG: hypothetical protein DRI61_04820 [Chloroflexota bacterium]HDN79053.1 hypothetical protein [Chloroflexota bacterium]